MPEPSVHEQVSDWLPDAEEWGGRVEHRECADHEVLVDHRGDVHHDIDQQNIPCDRREPVEESAYS